MSARVFLHRPLCAPSLLARILGPDGHGALEGALSLPGHSLAQGPAAGAIPSLVAGGRDREPVEGEIWALTPEALARLDRFMAFQGGRRCDLPGTDAGPGGVQGYFRDSESIEAWDPDDWGPRLLAIMEHAAVEILDLDPGRGRGLHGDAERDPAGRLNNILVRAAARLRAGKGSRPRHAEGPGREAVDVRADRVSHDGFFQTRTTELRHPRFDGGLCDWMERECFVAADAVTVLPYDPSRDRVMLAEQFRGSLYLRGEAYPWSIEPLAGRIDPGEEAAAAARREVREEASLEIGALERIAGYYPATGTTTEYVISYIGLAELPDGAGGIGGEASEGEDIRTFVLPFDEAMALMAEDQTRNAPLIISLLWLAANRERLRAGGA
ncbi:nudix-type nucleoside diphosphatase (YffH/AdpP family) [Brevirhabdus pacifica]|uniref:NUDIX domain-containing protein n=1 Tax=Brevirhabdus pacifica TaxID=1267768 RepID=UPI0009F8BAFD|nr:NUDIX domain-containing protein [Brevirhabdus pacifica]PJJ86715.1 nudix-type nucleoside diphosphatase (YffH/AdpP family) [Brevirhabdus pacifica]